jgi:hypothetical protein
MYVIVNVSVPKHKSYDREFDYLVLWNCLKFYDIDQEKFLSYMTHRYTPANTFT